MRTMQLKELELGTIDLSNYLLSIYLPIYASIYLSYLSIYVYREDQSSNQASTSLNINSILSLYLSSIDLTIHLEGFP